MTAAATAAPVAIQCPPLWGDRTIEGIGERLPCFLEALLQRRRAVDVEVDN
jgi:hypothetical protein